MALLDDIIGMFGNSSPEVGAGIDPQALKAILASAKQVGVLQSTSPVPFSNLGGLPPQTNDPMAGQPQHFQNGVPLSPSAADAPPDASQNDATAPATFDDRFSTTPSLSAGVPLPRPRPDDAPLSLAPQDSPSLPANAVPTVGNAPPIAPPVARSPQQPAAPDQNGFGSILGRLFNPDHAETLMALGAGFAGAPSFGTGMSRALSNAVPAAAADRQFALKQGVVNQTATALMKRGFPQDAAVALASNPSALAPVLSQLYGPKQATWGVIGHDNFGNPSYGFINSFDKTVSPPANAPAGTGVNAQPFDPSVVGDAFLKTLDPAQAGMVKQIAEGRSPYPTGMLAKTPYGQRLQQMVTQYDPTFNAQTAGARQKMLNDLQGNGRLGQINNKLNTAIGHLGVVSDLADKLNNYSEGSFGPGTQYVNQFKNWWNTKSGNQSAPNFTNAIGKVSEELTSAYRGAGGSEADIQRELKNVNDAQSPEQIFGALRTMGNLLESKISENDQQVRDTMGPLFKYDGAIRPNNREILNTLEDRASGAAPAAATPALSSAPAVLPQPQNAVAAEPPSVADPLSQARDAIARGAPRNLVITRLLKSGINPAGL